MEKKILSFLFSTRLMAFLFIAYAVAMASGTFIESTYNTDTARILIYNSKWFEAIHLFFLINFIGNIPRYRLMRKEKWATLLLHLSFIFIIIGAAITRYISYEGMMPIREQATENKVYSDRTFLTLFVDGDYQGSMKRRVFEKPLLLSPVTNNDFDIQADFADIPFKVSYKNYLMGATETIREDAKGTLYLKMVESGDGSRHEHYLKEGEVQNIHNTLFSLNKFVQGAININTSGNIYTIQAPFDGQYMRMADRMQGQLVKNEKQPLMLRSLYRVGGTQFVFPEPAKKGFKTFIPKNDFKSKKHEDALIVTVESQGKTKEVTLLGTKGSAGAPETFTLGKLDFTLSFGSKVYELPFQIKLNDFIAKKYPGTEKSYAAFESKVTVLDGQQKQDARIYMNHILDYKGYRFFQSSFDHDEQGTVLSVNHDFWGTTITYIGYFLLFFSLMAIMFTKHSRFAEVKRKLETVKQKKAQLLSILMLFLSVQMFSQNHLHQAPKLQQIDSLINRYKTSEAHAAKFGRLIVQDEGGRMKPINTFSSELLRKVSKSDTYKELNSDQVFLSMTQFPRLWFEVPLIYLKSGNDSIRKIIGVDAQQKYAPFIKFFDNNGNYKLSSYLEEAYKAAVPDQFQKDFIETDRKVNLLNSALSGSILRIYPVPNDKNNKWVSYLELDKANIHGIDSTFTKNILPLYMQALDSAAIKGNYVNANFFLQSIENYQKKFGSAVRPSDDKINSEITYNKYDIFKKLYYLYMLTGVLMLLVTILNIFFEKKFLRVTINVFHIFVGLLFLLHTAGLAARWYISGHAPWSDAYESMIYVAWATMFFTLAFDIKSKLTVASGTFVASMILMIAHWNWMDPSIANLQPVLNSYWLMIHVAVIVASYGPFTLGMVLGVVSLLLMIFTNEKNKAKMELNIQEITYINEMALTIGLIMLTIGNFLGGQWANESWGRYWGWDPKETWALISIMIYAFVIHARFVPSLRGRWVFNLMSVVAFYSIMMTYFGVNFYLTGMHSYASGDKVVTPSFVYYSVACVALLGIVSYIFYRKHYKK
ncbi:cytochrome c biogenesis protein CcsA [Flavobacterium sp. CYK-55]|uniref:cytochrome c biogenesis protein CcsA n=1 Tax=Flavobacterium sp. CYK-55 TaxID=2835529 RepID=UPI001BCECC01|nr:cytochrome c biogenesis protein CcsA [Flavobacterium sp. CYK-55]MBS7786690.1 cytochrome c biogenesis protein CcsA [Flavobacterium sp. CYK-55]